MILQPLLLLVVVVDFVESESMFFRLRQPGSVASENKVVGVPSGEDRLQESPLSVLAQDVTSIEAVVEATAPDVGVDFFVDGVFVRREKAVPFMLDGDSESIKGRRFAAGLHEIFANATRAKDGAFVVRRRQRFVVAESLAPSIGEFRMFAEKAANPSRSTPLYEGRFLFEECPSLNVAADVQGGDPLPRGVDFYFDGAYVRTEFREPYFLFGDDDGVWNYGDMDAGPHTVKAVILGSQGDLLVSREVKFQCAGLLPTNIETLTLERFAADGKTKCGPDIALERIQTDPKTGAHLRPPTKVGKAAFFTIEAVVEDYDRQRLVAAGQKRRVEVRFSVDYTGKYQKEYRAPFFLFGDDGGFGDDAVPVLEPLVDGKLYEVEAAVNLDTLGNGYYFSTSDWKNFQTRFQVDATKPQGRDADFGIFYETFYDPDSIFYELVPEGYQFDPDSRRDIRFILADRCGNVVPKSAAFAFFVDGQNFATASTFDSDFLDALILKPGNYSVEGRNLDDGASTGIFSFGIAESLLGYEQFDVDVAVNLGQPPAGLISIVFPSSLRTVPSTFYFDSIRRQTDFFAPAIYGYRVGLPQTQTLRGLNCEQLAYVIFRIQDGFNYQTVETIDTLQVNGVDIDIPPLCIGQAFDEDLCEPPRLQYTDFNVSIPLEARCAND